MYVALSNNLFCGVTEQHPIANTINANNTRNPKRFLQKVTALWMHGKEWKTTNRSMNVHTFNTLVVSRLIFVTDCTIVLKGYYEIRK